MYDTEAAGKYLFRAKTIDTKFKRKKVQRSSSDVFTVPFEQVNIFHVSKLLVETRERYQQRPLLFPKFLLTRFYFV